MDVHDNLLQNIALELAKDRDCSQAINRIYAESLTQVFAIHLLKNYCEVNRVVKIDDSVISMKMVARVTDYIYTNIDNHDLCLDDLAKVACISRSHFIRRFKQAVGVIPARYLKQLRLERAKILLVGHSLSIEQVSTAVGFSEQSRFAAAFKKMFGVSPGQFRKSIRNNFLN